MKRPAPSSPHSRRAGPRPDRLRRVRRRRRRPGHRRLVPGAEQTHPAGPERPGHGAVAPRPGRPTFLSWTGPTTRMPGRCAVSGSPPIWPRGHRGVYRHGGRGPGQRADETVIGLHKTELIKPRRPWAQCPSPAREPAHPGSTTSRSRPRLRSSHRQAPRDTHGLLAQQALRCLPS
jgi:hypothetical protein